MEMPKLRPRPVSHQTCTRFRGLDRRPGASNKSYNKSWHMGWHDEMNLSSDRFPRLSVRPARGQVAEIDGNVPLDEVIAMCGGDHALVLDASGTLWCNGSSVYLAGQDGVSYSWKVSPGPTGMSVTPNENNTGSVEYLDDVQMVLSDAWNGHRGTATLVYDPANAPDLKHWHFIEGDDWVSLSDLGLVATKLPKQGDSFTVDFYVSCTFGKNPTIIRMGAYAVIYPGWVWCNAVKLANGDELTEGVDFGPCRGMAYSDGSTLTLTLCDIDGEPYSGVTVSSSEPSTQSGYWLDTSGKPVLKEWSTVQSIWVQITSTFVKISTLRHEGLYDNIRKGDGVTITTECAYGTDAGVETLLNSDHYIYEADIDEENGGWIMVSGILPSDTVTVNLVDTGCLVDRDPPVLDFVVEAGNRLWGCRYSEDDSLNEIYASKLGDFKNWHVYQGLATDSWTASRGTAAPFTGAITLSGNPLFFREDSLEKVFPSAAGAHQIASYSLEGVQQGSSGSMVVIDERLFYKSRMGVCVYSGTLPARISEEFEDWEFRNATAARHRRKYAICMSRPPVRGRTIFEPRTAERLCMVYDLDTGDWHVEDECWDGIAITWNDDLYYVKDGVIYSFAYSSGSSEVEWYAESDDMGIELPEHKWISYMRLRFSLEMNASCRVYISYDGGPWLRKGTLHGNRLHSQELGIWPKRCDHFRLRLEGFGGCELQSISYAMESSQLKH